MLPDSIESVDLDIDVIDADGEIPARTITTLILEGDFVNAVGKYLEDEENFRLVLVIDDDLIEHLYKKTSEYMGESRY